MVGYTLIAVFWAIKRYASAELNDSVPYGIPPLEEVPIHIFTTFHDAGRDAYWA